MRMKKTLRAAAAVAMTGCLMQANCLTVNSRGVSIFTNGLIGTVQDAVNAGIADASVGVSATIAGLISDAITGALP